MTTTLPPALLFGYWGFTPFPWLMILSSAQKDNPALIAHEQCHQAQQRRDGTLTFWWRYTTNTAWRLSYEVEAYKVWLTVNPVDEWRVVHWLASNYNLGISTKDARELLGLP